MKELRKFRQFLNEEIEEGIFDFMKKSTPKEDPTPEDVPSEPTLPEWILMAFVGKDVQTVLETKKLMDSFKKDKNTSWVQSPSDFLETLGAIKGAKFAGITSSLGKEIFAAQTKDKSKNSLEKLGVPKEKVDAIEDKMVFLNKGAKLSMLSQKSLKDLMSESVQEDRKAKEYIQSIEDEDEREDEKKRMFGDDELDKDDKVRAGVKSAAEKLGMKPSHIKETLDEDLNIGDEVYAMMGNLVEYIGAETLVEELIAAMSTDDAKLYLSAIMRDYDLGPDRDGSSAAFNKRLGGMKEGVEDGLDRLVDAFEKLDDVARKAFMKLIGKGKVEEVEGDEGYYVVYQSHKSSRGGDGVDVSNASTSKEFKKFPFTDEPTSKEAREEAHKHARLMNDDITDRFIYTVGQYNPYPFISR